MWASCPVSGAPLVGPPVRRRTVKRRERYGARQGMSNAARTFHPRAGPRTVERPLPAAASADAAAVRLAATARRGRTAVGVRAAQDEAGRRRARGGIDAEGVRRHAGADAADQPPGCAARRGVEAADRDAAPAVDGA